MGSSHVFDIRDTGWRPVLCHPSVRASGTFVFLSEFLATPKCPAVDEEWHADKISRVLESGTFCCNTTSFSQISNLLHKITSGKFRHSIWLLSCQASLGSPCNSAILVVWALFPVRSTGEVWTMPRLDVVPCPILCALVFDLVSLLFLLCVDHKQWWLSLTVLKFFHQAFHLVPF